MSKEDKFRVGMALHKIAMSVDDMTLKKIQEYLNTIEIVCAEQPETVNVPVLGEVE